MGKRESMAKPEMRNSGRNRPKNTTLTLTKMVEKPEESEKSILTPKSQTLGPQHQKKRSSQNKLEKTHIPLHKPSKNAL